MELGLKGKTALIGGASKGLGKACALQLAKEGVRVAICARGEEALKAAEADIKRIANADVLSIRADFSKMDDVRKAVAQTLKTFGKIDILVVNSGGPRPGKFFDLSQQDWENAFHSVLYYVVELYRLVVPEMRKNKWGRIINIASSTVKEPNEDLILSNVFRSGVVSMAKTLSRELIADNITINTICPAAFKTDRAVQLMGEQAKAQGISVAQVEQKVIQGLPLKRFNSPEELAGLAVYLASELAGGTTGTVTQIDGGLQKSIF